MRRSPWPGRSGNSCPRSRIRSIWTRLTSRGFTRSVFGRALSTAVRTRHCRPALFTLECRRGSESSNSSRWREATRSCSPVPRNWQPSSSRQARTEERRQSRPVDSSVDQVAECVQLIGERTGRVTAGIGESAPAPRTFLHFLPRVVRSNPSWVKHRAAFCLALLFFAAPLATEAQEAAKPVAPFKLPEEKDLPKGPLGDAIRYGEQVLIQTQVYAKRYIGNGLNCTSCH